MSLLIFVAILSILIISHEFGHFIAARWAGIKVEQFAIGFGPAVFKRKIKETDFLICAVPLGGYIRMAGDDRNKCKGTPEEFFSKPVGIRAKVVFFGPFFNIVLSLLIFWFIFMTGFPVTQSIVGKVLKDYPAQKAGIKEGDKIIEINAQRVENWRDVVRIIHNAKEGKVKVTLKRADKIIHLSIAPVEKQVKDIFGKKTVIKLIGIGPSSEVKIVRFGIVESFLKSFQRTAEVVFLTLKGFFMIIVGAVPVREAISGPLGIYYITSQVVKIGWYAVLNLAATLSLSLGLINLFPLPVLDGGHLFLFGLEKIRKKPLSDKTESVLTNIGITVIVILMLFVFYNDIVRFGAKIIGK